ncbi:MATE efflux family protein [Fusobacterium necrophorum subsp. funduliforme 1_1_36S]|nr:MATE efflux family protein [Fusobacterium necrophorum subsp. funduliforme 1_1_36S]
MLYDTLENGSRNSLPGSSCCGRNDSLYDDLDTGYYDGWKVWGKTCCFFCRIKYRNHLFFFNILIAIGISSSLTSLISRALGAKDFKKAERIANAGFKLSFALAILFFVILFFVPKQILLLAGATEDMLPFATEYAKISAFSFFLLTFSSTNNGMFRGAKDTKTSLYVAALINIVNLSLDYVLIFGKFGFPEWGVRGAAIATVAGNGAGLLLQWTRLKKLPFHLHLFSVSKKEDFWEVIRLAVPSALQEANFSLSKLLGITFVMSLGTVAFAANQIGIAIEAVSFMPGWGIAIANTALVGHSIGAKNEKRPTITLSILRSSLPFSWE